MNAAETALTLYIYAGPAGILFVSLFTGYHIIREFRASRDSGLGLFPEEETSKRPGAGQDALAHTPIERI